MFFVIVFFLGYLHLYFDHMMITQITITKLELIAILLNYENTPIQSH